MSHRDLFLGWLGSGVILTLSSGLIQTIAQVIFALISVVGLALIVYQNQVDSVADGIRKAREDDQ